MRNKLRYQNSLESEFVLFETQISYMQLDSTAALWDLAVSKTVYSCIPHNRPHNWPFQFAYKHVKIERIFTILIFKESNFAEFQSCYSQLAGSKLDGYQWLFDNLVPMFFACLGYPYRQLAVSCRVLIFLL